MNVLTALGLLIYAAATVLDRFVKRMPNALAIPVYLLGIACLVLGMLLSRRSA